MKRQFCNETDIKGRDDSYAYIFEVDCPEEMKYILGIVDLGGQGIFATVVFFLAAKRHSCY